MEGRAGVGEGGGSGEGERKEEGEGGRVRDGGRGKGGGVDSLPPETSLMHKLRRSQPRCDTHSLLKPL